MRDVRHYLDAARDRNRIRTDAELSRMLGKQRGACNHYRQGRTLPDDETMVVLAGLAGIDPADALLDLNRWRSSGAARETYQEIARRLAKTAAVILVGISLVFFNYASPVQAATFDEQSNAKAGYFVYYGKFRRWLRQVWKRLKNAVSPYSRSAHRLLTTAA